MAHAYAGGAGVTFEYRYNTENGVRARLVSDATYQAGAGNPALAVGTRGYTANALNQYTAVAGTSLTYDNDGNLSGDGVWTYGHDAQGRLVSAAKAGTTIGYGYDAAGRRRSRTVNGVTTTSLWSGDQEVAEYDAAGALVRRFVWGPMGVHEILAIIGVVGGPAARRRFQHADGIGTVVAATTGNGSLEAKFAYTPYGVADSNAGPPWRFTGRRLDADTGLYYLRARDYARAIGEALRGDTAAGGVSAKVIMRWTGASERSVKGWISGRQGPSGEHLMALMQRSDAVWEAVQRLAGRRSAPSTQAIEAARQHLIPTLVAIDSRGGFPDAAAM